MPMAMRYVESDGLPDDLNVEHFLVLLQFSESIFVLVNIHLNGIFK